MSLSNLRLADIHRMSTNINSTSTDYDFRFTVQQRLFGYKHTCHSFRKIELLYKLCSTNLFVVNHVKAGPGLGYSCLFCIC